MTAVALTSESKTTKAPKGYLSLEELSKKYPDFHDDYMTPSGRDRPMQVWVDEDNPIFASICEKIDPQLTEKEMAERRNMRGKTKFKMEEDRYKEILIQIPPRQEYPMTINNYVYLWGDPNFRLDLDSKPEKAVSYVKGMSDSRWNAYKRTAWDRFRRNPACKESVRHTQHGEEKLPAKYSVGTFDTRNTELGLWATIPNVYVLPPDSYSYTVKEDTTLEEKVLDALKESNLALGKAVYRDEELVGVKEILVAKGIIKDTSSLTKVRSLIKIAQTEDKVDESEPAEV